MNALFEWLISIINEFKCWVIVQPWERSIRTRCGKNPVVLAEGVHLRLPIVDEFRVFNNRLRTYVFPQQTVSTKDGKHVTVAGLVGFRIVDPLAAHLSMKEPETSVSGFAQRCAAEYISTRSLDVIDLADMNERIATELAAMTEGLTFDFVSITEFGSFRTLRILQENWRPFTDIDKHVS